MNSDFLYEEAQEFQDSQVPPDEGVRQIANLARKQLDYEERIANLEQEVKDAKDALRRVQERELPSLMTELGVQDFTLEDGSKISIKSFVSASIPKDNKEQAFHWLEEHGHGDIVKHSVVADVGKAPESAQAALSALLELGIPAVDNKNVHPQTLKAFIKEQVEGGQPVPLDLFGAYLGQKSTIKKGK